MTGDCLLLSFNSTYIRKLILMWAIEIFWKVIQSIIRICPQCVAYPCCNTLSYFMNSLLPIIFHKQSLYRKLKQYTFLNIFSFYWYFIYLTCTESRVESWTYPSWILLPSYILTRRPHSFPSLLAVALQDPKLFLWWSNYYLVFHGVKEYHGLLASPLVLDLDIDI